MTLATTGKKTLAIDIGSGRSTHGALGGVARPSSLEPQQVAERSPRIPQLWCSPASTEMNSPSGGVA